MVNLFFPKKKKTENILKRNIGTVTPTNKYTWIFKNEFYTIHVPHILNSTLSRPIQHGTRDSKLTTFQLLQMLTLSEAWTVGFDALHMELLKTFDEPRGRGGIKVDICV